MWGCHSLGTYQPWVLATWCLSIWWVKIFHCFHLHFPNDLWGSISFLSYGAFLCLIFSDFTHACCLFFCCIFGFFSWDWFLGTLYIRLDSNVIIFANISSQLMTGLTNLFMVFVLYRSFHSWFDQSSGISRYSFLILLCLGRCSPLPLISSGLCSYQP